MKHVIKILLLIIFSQTLYAEMNISRSQLSTALMHNDYKVIRNATVEQLLDVISNSKRVSDGEYQPAIWVYNRLLIEPEKMPLVEASVEDIWSIDSESFNKFNNRDYVRSLYQLTKKYKIENNKYLYYSFKRYLTYICHYNYSIYHPESCVAMMYNQYKINLLNSSSFWEHGRWAMYDNDINTYAVLDLAKLNFYVEAGKKFKINLELLNRPLGDLLFLCGGMVTNYTTNQYLFIKRIKIRSIEPLVIQLTNKKGWQEIALPNDLNLKGTLLTVSNTTKRKDEKILIYEILEDFDYKKESLSGQIYYEYLKNSRI